MPQTDLGELKNRAQLYSEEIDSDLTAIRSTSSIMTAGFSKADVIVDFTRDVVDEIRIQHLSGGYIEQVEDDSALPDVVLLDLLYIKTVTDDKKFKFSVDLNSRYTQFVISSLSAAVESVVFAGVGLDDATSGGTYSGSDPLEYLVEIDGAGTPDTFRWSKDGGATWTASTVAITGSSQVLDSGVTVTFAATTGHTVADQWTIKTGYGSTSDTITVDVTLR